MSSKIGVETKHDNYDLTTLGVSKASYPSRAPDAPELGASCATLVQTTPTRSPSRREYVQHADTGSSHHEAHSERHKQSARATIGRARIRTRVSDRQPLSMGAGSLTSCHFCSGALISGYVAIMTITNTMAHAATVAEVRTGQVSCSVGCAQYAAQEQPRARASKACRSRGQPPLPRSCAVQNCPSTSTASLTTTL